ncbi:hypothetical protein I316_03714 [Kwoniella heveanensis BCC8398]|uniref:Uncharacterized protein n=1 Tax=Kwoniella heveanensis BCC8398 TaxID=1296120 RepID=A0A1B9GUE0_9TREE|nr:hypothetical protein I316_03714 [Kwoniella heveanensis BCC8398]
MPPLFTSTSVTTILRKIITVAKYAPTAAPAPAHHIMSRGKAGRTINNFHKTKNAINQAIHQTFPSLATPSHQLQYATIPIRNASSRRGFATAASGKGPGSGRRVGGPVRQAIQNSGARPKWTNGPGISANVGLGSARGFASSTSGSVQANVPIVLRAFASLLDDDEKKHSLKPLPRASRYTPYTQPTRFQRQRRARRAPSTCSIDSSLIIKEIQHYFPLPSPTRSIEEQQCQIALPPTPETLVTDGKITVLALPLSPSLEALLLPTARMAYSEASIGIHILARLTQGLMPIHNAFSLHSSTRIIPLLTKLDGLGVLEYHPDASMPNTEAQVIHDAEGRPDILRLVFHGRSVGDVRTLLGESLRKTEEGDWWALYEHEDEEEGDGMELTVKERTEIMEQWDAPPSASRPKASAVPATAGSEQLIFPTLDMSIAPTVTSIGRHGESAVLFDVDADVDTSTGLSSSWTVSGSSTPSPIESISPLSNAGSSSSVNPESLATSLLSLQSYSDSDYDSELDLDLGSEYAWSVHPSESDSDVESAYSSVIVSNSNAEAAEWNAVSHSQVQSQQDEDEAEVDEGLMVFSNWTGSGEGFGFLSQPW